MAKGRQSIPVALTIAGSDSGGGAGIQADLKTFTAMGVHGASVITAITAQNPRGVLGVQACEGGIVRKQLEAVFAELRPRACKTGMLFSAETVEIVAEFFGEKRRPPLVVDPVMIATSGAALMDSRAIKSLKQLLLPRATLVTPNVAEGEALLGKKIRSVEELRLAAKAIFAQYGCATLMKGGHLRGGKEAVDFFYDGKMELMLTAPRIKAGRLHGTGCTYSAAITAQLAKGKSVAKAVEVAKEYVTRAIEGRMFVGRHPVLLNNSVRHGGS
jgi:hydroxymethylpyrimidine kinase/phosphomethylpyrimidine kinase